MLKYQQHTKYCQIDKKEKIMILKIDLNQMNKAKNIQINNIMPDIKVKNDMQLKIKGRTIKISLLMTHTSKKIESLANQEEEQI